MAPFSSVVGKRPHAARLMAVLANSTWWQDIFAAAKVEPEAPETSGCSTIHINGCGFFLRSLRWPLFAGEAFIALRHMTEKSGHKDSAVPQDVPVAGDGPEIHDDGTHTCVFRRS